MRTLLPVGSYGAVRAAFLLAGGLAGSLGGGALGCDAGPLDAAPELRRDGSGPGDGPADASSPDLADEALGRCPSGMVLIPKGAGVASDFCIDRYEAATATLAPDGNLKLHPFDQPVDGLTVWAVVPAVAVGEKPQAYISAVQARAACEKSGKRLCSAPQWLHACRGALDTVYPYGNTYQKGFCNEGRATNPVNDCFGSGSGVFTSAHLNSPCCVAQPNTVAVGGTFARCQSSYGVFDLHGNLHEWVDETAASGHGVFRGGFFVDAKINGAGCTYRTTAHLPSYHDYSNGFRCCADAK